MAQTYLNNIAGLSKLGLPATIERGKAAPLEKYYLQDTYADALDYAKNHGAAYPYMLIAVERDSDVTKNGIYYINGNPGPDAELIKVGDDVKSPALSAETYSAATVLATVENIGQVVYVTTDEPIADSDEKYSAGLYIVTGAGQLAKLGTVSATGDLAGDVETIKGDVGTLKTDVGALQGVIGNESSGLVADIATAKSDIDSIKTDLNGNGENIPGLKADVAAAKSDIESLKVNIASKISGVKVDSVVIEPENGVVNITLPSFTLEDVTEPGGLKKYQLYKDGEAIEGSVIEFDKDLFIKSGSIYTANEDSSTVYPNQPEGTFEVGKKYIKLELNDDNNSLVFIKLDDLFTPYQGSDYIDVSSSNVISIKVDDLKAKLEDTFATKDDVDTLAAKIISVGGSGAIDVASSGSNGTDLTVSLLVKNDEDGAPLKGNIKFTQSAEDGLVGEMMWSQY